MNASTVADPVTRALAAARILPVVVNQDATAAPALATALVAGGLRLVEVTLRTSAALDTLRSMAADPDLIAGAGTVVSETQVDLAIDAGARFIVSPGFDARIVRRCQQHDVPVYPGVATATELLAALDAGVTTVKFFPAELLGGLAMISALAAPFGAVRFIPTGGIGPTQLPAYLDHPAVLAVGGSWMVAPGLIAAGAWTQISSAAAQAVSIVNRHRVA